MHFSYNLLRFETKKITAIMTFVTMSDNGVLQTRDNSLCQK